MQPLQQIYNAKCSARAYYPPPSELLNRIADENCERLGGVLLAVFGCLFAHRPLSSRSSLRLVLGMQPLQQIYRAMHSARAYYPPPSELLN